MALVPHAPAADVCQLLAASGELTARAPHPPRVCRPRSSSRGLPSGQEQHPLPARCGGLGTQGTRSVPRRRGGRRLAVPSCCRGRGEKPCRGSDAKPGRSALPAGRTQQPGVRASDDWSWQGGRGEGSETRLGQHLERVEWSRSIDVPHAAPCLGDGGGRSHRSLASSLSWLSHKHCLFKLGLVEAVRPLTAALFSLPPTGA